jgi:putative ABC transport system permease protein
LGLSIGIAGLIFATLYWNDEHSYNEWNPGKDKIYQVQTDLRNGAVWAHSVAGLEAYLKKDFPEIEAYTFMENWYEEYVFNSGSKKNLVKKVLSAQKGFFNFFPFEFIYGSAENSLKNEESIVLSEKTARNFFGDDNPVGKTIIVNKKSVFITGVYKIPGNSSVSPDAIVNRIDKSLKNNFDQWGNFNFGLFIKVSNKDHLDRIKLKIAEIYHDNRDRRWSKEQGLSKEETEKKIKENGIKILLEPLTDARLKAKVDGYPEGKGNYQFLLVMFGMSVLILVLSIVNYVNLATANAISRAKEVGVRKILGASKSNIVKQFMFETILMVLFAILLSLVIVELSLPYYNEFLDKNLVIFGNDFYLQLVFIFILIIVLAGIFPAIYVSNFETLKVLKGNFGRSKKGIWLRNGMLILQFSIATFFIVGSYIVYQQVHFISTKDVGFSGNQVLTVFLNNSDIYEKEDMGEIKNGALQIYKKYELIKQEVSKIRGVEEVNTGAFNFGSDSNSSSGFEYNGESIQGQNMAIDFGMLDMMNIKIKQGRNLSPKFASDTINSMLINETALKMMKEKNPIGKKVKWNNYELTIVGIVNDFNLYSPQSKVPPMSFFHFKTIDWMPYNLNRIHIKVNSEHMQQTILDIEKFWVKNIDSDYPFTYDFVDKQYARTYASYVKQRNLFGLLNFIVILIALFGLFALATYSIQRRMKEIAIRKTLGAETTVLLKQLSKQYIVFCFIGFVIALFPVYYLLNMWLEGFAFRISISWIPFVIGFVVLVVLTLVVVLSRAYVATRVNVLKYLKYE